MRASLLLLAVLALVNAAAALYSAKDDVIIATPENFDEIVTKGDGK